MLLRSVVVYVLTFAVIRLMGKRQVGEMQPFEFVITLIIADLACTPMSELAVPLVHGVVPILALYLVHFFICFLSRKFMWFRYGITGRPAIVISPRGIDYNELKKLNMTLDDLMEALRGCSFFEIDQVAYAIIETNGKLCVIPKSSSAPVTRGDLKIEGEQAAFPINIIMDGKLMKENMKLAKIDDDFLKKYYRQTKVKSYRHILLFTIDSNGKVFIQPKDASKYYVFEKQTYKGEQPW